MKTMVREKPILFSGPMVKAILERRKTQTRRVVKPQPSFPVAEFVYDDCNCQWEAWSSQGPDDKSYWTEDYTCPYGQPGDRLWVRETWQQDPAGDRAVCYRATGHDPKCVIPDHLWRPSIFMPRELSRLTLEITNVRVERLQSISAADCVAEGLSPTMRNESPVKDRFRELWDSVNGKSHPWQSNCWVWVIEFRRL